MWDLVEVLLEVNICDRVWADFFFLPLFICCQIKLFVSVAKLPGRYHLWLSSTFLCIFLLVNSALYNLSKILALLLFFDLLHLVHLLLSSLNLPLFDTLSGTRLSSASHLKLEMSLKASHDGLHFSVHETRIVFYYLLLQHFHGIGCRGTLVLLDLELTIGVGMASQDLLLVLIGWGDTLVLFLMLDQRIEKLWFLFNIFLALVVAFHFNFFLNCWEICAAGR